MGPEQNVRRVADRIFECIVGFFFRYQIKQIRTHASSTGSGLASDKLLPESMSGAILHHWAMISYHVIVLKFFASRRIAVLCLLMA